MINNRYIFPEEVKRIIESLCKFPNTIKMVYLIYNKGYTVKQAFYEISSNVCRRSHEYRLQKASNHLINFQDLRRAYLYDHPIYVYKKRNRKPINARLRWFVLSRDNFKCQACGKSSRETILHVDHILPISLNGKTEENNLRTLCAECNMGKGCILLEILPKKVNVEPLNTNLGGCRG